MFVKRKGDLNRAKSIYRGCVRFAEQLGIKICEKQNQFTLSKALHEGDVMWFGMDHMNCDEYDTFIRMVIAYSKSDRHDRVPKAKLIVHIECPICKRCQMTPRQVVLNTITCGNESFIICNNCGMIMRIDEPLEVKNDNIPSE